MLGAIILAAGLSARMGCEKLLLPIGEQKLLEKTVAGVVKNFEDVIVIVTRENILAQIKKNKKAVYLVNPQPDLGQSSSLKTAVAHIMSRYPDCEGVLVFLGDQPLIRGTLIEEIKNTLRENPEKIVCPEYKGRRGHPVAFGKHWLPALLATTGDAGGRVIIKNHPEALIRIPGDESCRMDADTPEDYRRLITYYEREWSEE